ncbi:hypothetical protein [Allokutzneria albata]|uniref:Uncharacterized protein n=1 Tax=Allokutzneria albata TaxID=211114 RepID=A0A1G9VPY3_ALLAB|nr:hypothetical protein [Allokutzneria albata]SDM73875.1 hypothetical protein SAMN04489726_3147 [Allokutzneria albata]
MDGTLSDAELRRRYGRWLQGLPEFLRLMPAEGTVELFDDSAGRELTGLRLFTPASSAEIDWEVHAFLAQHSASGDDEVAAHVASAMAPHVAENRRVAVVWTTSLPIAVFSAEQVVRHALDIVTASGTLWLQPLGGGALVEVQADGRVTTGVAADPRR